MLNTNSKLNYRLFDLPPTLMLLIISRLATAPNSKAEASYNAMTLNRFSDVFDDLRYCEPAILTKLSEQADEWAVISIDMGKLHQLLLSLSYVGDRHEEQLSQAKWLITNKASNQLIMDICTLISPDDIKRIRLQTNEPSGKGRLVLPPLEERLTILQDWEKLSAEKDLFHKYRKLSLLYPHLGLGQLHSIIKNGR